MCALRSSEDVLAGDAPFRGVLRLPCANLRTQGTIVLAHGFCVNARAYSSLADLWCGDGWAVYAPQLYTPCTPICEEVDALAQACAFAFAQLPRPLLLAGHSRGAQAALVLLLRLTSAAADLAFVDRPWRHGDSVRADGVPIVRRRVVGAPPLAAFKGLVLLDPVEGRPGPLGMGLRRLILGAAGLDWRWASVPVLLIAASGAPPGHDAAALYSALRAATLVGDGRIECPFHLIEARRFGHLDFLDDALLAAGILPALASCLLPGDRGKRDELRTLTRDAVHIVFGEGNPHSIARRLAALEERVTPP